MSKVMKLFALISLSILTGHSFASGSTAWGTVTEIYVHGAWTMVRVSDVTGNPLNDNPDECFSETYYALEPADLNYNVLHSTLLAAHMSGKDVRFWVDDCEGQNSAYPHIKSVFVK